ncbi:MAG: hypothetical protein FWG04_02795 [Desulfovibrionaceae bacterium]|nr:hypothetical protein [Desulfovibrionaceae bacterium]
MHQTSLLDLVPHSGGGTSGLAGLMPSIRAAMYRVADAYGPGRKMLAEAISKVARREGVSLGSTGAKSVSEEVLDKWLQTGAPGHEPNLKALLCFCIATQDFSPLEPIWKACGLAVIPADDLRYLRVGKAQVRLQEAKEEYNKARAGL